MCSKRNEVKRIHPIQINPTVANIKLLYSASEILSQWKKVISEAQTSIMFSTYVWNIWDREKKSVTPHIICLGVALSMIKTPITVKIIINRIGWLNKKKNLKKTIDETLGIWKKIGVDFKIVTVFWGIWSHRSLGNIHTKVVIVDDMISIIHSLNVEYCSHGGDGSWSEVGVLINDKVINSHIRDDFYLHWTKCEHWKRAPIEVSDFQNAPDVCFSKPTREYQEAEIQVLFQHASRNIFKLSRNSDCIRSMMTLIQNAKSEIALMTPNFNDICVWNELKKKAEEGVKVRLMWVSGFNAKLPLFQKYLLGSRTNERMLEEIIKKNKPSNVNIRYYGFQKKIVTGVNNIVHSKVISVDREFFTIGSCNLDVFSTISSSEIIAIIKSKEIANELHRNYIEPFWDNAVTTA